jgi:ferredoxin-NADP reductase
MNPTTANRLRGTNTARPTDKAARRPRGADRRLLGSPLVDLLVGPHGIDRYLELISPELTLWDARAEIVAVQRQTPRSVTLTIRPNHAWEGFRAGQFVRVGYEIDGVRRTRTYSPASSQHAAHRELELTISFLPDGLVSSHLRAENPGGVVHLGAADGTFTLPDARPERLVLISGGSGITPVMSMLRTLIDEGHTGQIEFLHYGRTQQDWLYERQVREVAAAHPNVTSRYIATREGGAHFNRNTIEDPLTATAAVCGPPALIEAVKAVYADRPENVLNETFTPPTLTVTGDQAEGAIRFLKSQTTAEITTGTLLEQAEAAGLTPESGCRMGICHSCTRRKTSGVVKNLTTGVMSTTEAEDVQICVSVPVGDVDLAL